MSKRVIGILMILTLMTVSLLFGNNAVFASDGDVVVESYIVSDDSIYEGETFSLHIKLKSNSGRSLSGISLTFDTNSDFQVVGSGNVVPANTDLTAMNSIVMMYTGGSNLNIPVDIAYEYADDGTTGTTNTKLYIREAKPSSQQQQPQPSQRNPNNYKPVLELGISDIPQGKAGGIINIRLVFNNTSKYEAKNIRITPQLENTPFSIDQLTYYQTLEKVSPGKSAEFDFQFKVDKNASENNYKIPFKIDYTNIYGDNYDDLPKEENIYVSIINTSVPPQLVVREAKTNPAVINGEESFTVAFNVWNMGTLAAENVTIDLEANENFFVLDNITKEYLFEMKGLQNREITYSLKAKKELKTGTYGVTILLQHKDMQAPEKYTMYVSYEGNEEQEEEHNADIVTENVITPQAAVHTEHPFTISMDIVNTGSTKAKNVKVSMEAGDKILPQSLNILIIPEIEAGESVPAAFSFIPGKDCENQSYPIKAVIEYRNGEEAVKKEQYMGVLIESEKTTTLNTVPKIIISEYSSDPGMVNAGENFTLSMNFLNTSKLKSVENMKITLIVNESSEQTGSVFTPVQSSNTFYIDYLEPGQSSRKEMIMYTIPDAKAKTYDVKAVFEYEYEEQGQLKSNNMEDVFGIPVVQPAKLETTDVVVSEPAFVGEPLFITSEFYNMGKVALSNLMVKVEGNFDTKETNYFVGNFQTGYSDYYEARVTPTQPGELTGKVVYTFEDAAGVAHRIEKEFTVNVMEAMPVMNPGFPGGDMGNDMGKDMGRNSGMNGAQPSRFPLIPVIIGGVVVLAVILIIVLRRRKKKKEMVLDENI